MRKLAIVVVIVIAVSAGAQDAAWHDCEEIDAQRQPAVRPLSHSTCANGDFESGLDKSEWSGRHGVVSRKGEPEFLVSGLFSDPDIDSCAGHQTIVGAGLDPTTQLITTVAPGRSTKSLRLGNRAVDARTELLSKTFVVEPTQRVIHFSYAIVFQDPADHHDYQKPSFEVRVLDAAGNLIPGAVDLGGGKSKLIADKNLFPALADNLTVYKDWSCARIDLSTQVGKPVTVEFITEDCTKGAHFAYAYIDDFCGGENCGPVFKLVDGPRCGRGHLCFRATPDPLMIQLTILQTGAVLTNPQKNGDQFCFDIDPTIDFDFIATAEFPDGSILTSGAAPGGVDPGKVDYRVACPPCNLIVNGDFEAGNRDFGSDLTFAPASVRPGEYAVLDASEARAIAETWIACDGDGKFLVVNGSTCGSGPKKIWSQQVPVQPNTTYRFALQARNFPQRAFDVTPRIEVRFAGVGEPAVHAIRTSAEPCDWMTIERDIRIPPDMTALTIEIRLLDDTAGDGNDLALDDLSLCRIGG